MTLSSLLLSAVPLAAAIVFLPGMTVVAGDPLFQLPRETMRDMGSGFELKHEQAMKQFADPNLNMKVFKIDIDADVNRDGVIDDADGGWLEDTPPGLVMDVGEITPIRISLGSHYPYFPGSAVVRLEVCGINRENATGEFSSFEDEVQHSGHVIIWTDATKTRKLLDSADPKKRVLEWIIHPGYILPSHTGIPTNVFLEAVGPSGKYSGDVRVMATIAPLPPVQGEKQYKFHAAEDHILFTVLKK